MYLMSSKRNKDEVSFNLQLVVTPLKENLNLNLIATLFMWNSYINITKIAPFLLTSQCTFVKYKI